MNRFILFIILICMSTLVKAQQVDSIYFHLYTDSLKKGQHNYINVDGKLANGNWMPLTSKEIQFTCGQASFEGNELVIPMDFKPEKVTVRAVLKNNPSVWKEVTIWIKKTPDPRLPTRDEMLNNMKRNKGRT